MRRLLLLVVCIVVLFSCVSTVYAHPGNTDGNGGHTNRSTEEYHYHHGYPAHQHVDMNGDGKADCTYNFDDRTAGTSNNKSNSKSADSERTVSKRSGRVREFLTDTLPLILMLMAMFFIGTSWIVGIFNDDFAVFWISLGFKLIGIGFIVLLIGFGYTVLQSLWRLLTLCIA